MKNKKIYESVRWYIYTYRYKIITFEKLDTKFTINTKDICKELIKDINYN